MTALRFLVSVMRRAIARRWGANRFGRAFGSSVRRHSVICAWCRPGVTGGNISHGICRRHSREMLAGFEGR